MGDSGRVSQKYLDVLDKYILGGVPLKHMAMTEEGKLRTKIVYEAYQMWLSDKQISPHEVCMRISRRIYSDMAEAAKSNKDVALLCRRLGITEDSKRTYTQLKFDVQALDHIIGRFSAETSNIEKAKVLDASDWLIREGKKSGIGSNVSKGAELKLKVFNNFDDRTSAMDHLANTDISITADVSVIKTDRVNYSDEEKLSFRKRFGVTDKEMQTLIQNDKGEYEALAPMEEEPEDDLYIKAEKEANNG